MEEATRLTRAGRLAEATQVIQKALRPSAPTPTGEADHDTGKADAMVIDGCVFETHAAKPLTMPAATSRSRRSLSPRATEATRVDAAAAIEPARAAPSTDAGQGQFVKGRLTQGAINLAYKLYVPPGHAGRTLPLVVMLHGCTQHADDFAAGTGMNERAREQGFFVLYPEQSRDANPQGCWNWFKQSHQARAHGEPAAIVAATQQVMREYGIDARRVYIAGLSAGGAMAHIVALAYPEVFAAVGVHSGLAGGAAGTLTEALAAMKGGPGPRGAKSAPTPVDVGSRGAPTVAVPTIVFHGDRDATVHPVNGEQVVAASLRHAGADETAAPHVEQGTSRRGRPYTRRVSRDARGRVVAEHWVLHGAGHAWSGGDAAGSYTDAQGPDASVEMLRFFFAHPRG